jgi:microcystin-dependent protein
MDMYLASIVPYGFNFAPSGWQMCSGQILPVSQYQAVFALIGTFYGGNGSTTFGLPDLRGRMPIGINQGAGLPAYTIGQVGGAYQESLTLLNLPQHNHTATFTPSGSGGSVSVTVKALSTPPNATSPYATAPSATNNVLAATPTGGSFAGQMWAPATTSPDIAIGGVTATGGGGGGGTVSIGTTGSSTPINLMNPFLALNFCFCMNGLFPSRN